MPIVRIATAGARTVTILIAFDAGSRVEHREENGMAHFLEHAVFKGGERFPRPDDVNRTADRLGAQLNAYTASDHVAFHISVRSERALDAADLLTDFVGRPRLGAEDLEVERGVVVQEIARAYDQPATLADILIDTAAYGDHPLGRPILGTPETLGSFDREDLLAFRARRWASEKGAMIVAGDPSHLPDGELAELLDRIPASPPPPAAETAPPAEPQILVEPRESAQTHLRLGYRPAMDASDASTRRALQIYVTLLGGTSGSRLFEEIRERLGLAYSVRANDYPLADDAMVQIEAGLESRRCREAYERIREIVDRLAAEEISEEEIDRARSAAAGRKVLAFQRTATVAQHAALEHVVFGAEVDPDKEIAGLDSVDANAVAQVARSMAVEPAVACVGPHSVEDFA